MSTQQPTFPTGASEEAITQPSSTPRTFAALVDHMPKDCTEWSEVYLELSVVTRQLETELTAEREKVRVLREALDRLHDEQSYHCQYVADAIAATEELK
jgi:hypothetical protein